MKLSKGINMSNPDISDSIAPLTMDDLNRLVDLLNEDDSAPPMPSDAERIFEGAKRKAIDRFERLDRMEKDKRLDGIRSRIYAWLYDEGVAKFSRLLGKIAEEMDEETSRQVFANQDVKNILKNEDLTLLLSDRDASWSVERESMIQINKSFNFWKNLLVPFFSAMNFSRPVLRDIFKLLRKEINPQEIDPVYAYGAFNDGPEPSLSSSWGDRLADELGEILGLDESEEL